MLQTEFEFTLPRGYVDSDGNLQKNGVMRLATAADEILPLRDPRVKANQAYLVVILLSRVISRLGELRDINTKVVEELFSADLAYLQNYYRQINENGDDMVQATCPECNKTFGVDLGHPGE
ncbi:MAG: phage tail assembly protein [Dehalococcoidia bacterium]|nr:phage tail assembly protein [Dehalococcoidia bacterium]